MYTLQLTFATWSDSEFLGEEIPKPDVELKQLSRASVNWSPEPCIYSAVILPAWTQDMYVDFCCPHFGPRQLSAAVLLPLCKTNMSSAGACALSSTRSVSKDPLILSIDFGCLDLAIQPHRLKHWEIHFLRPNHDFDDDFTTKYRVQCSVNMASTPWPVNMASFKPSLRNVFLGLALARGDRLLPSAAGVAAGSPALPCRHGGLRVGKPRIRCPVLVGSSSSSPPL
jgi:hypothetical protein